MSFRRHIKRSLVDQTVRELVGIVKGLQADIVKLNLRQMVTERIVKEKFALTDTDINAVIEAMLRKGDEKAAEQRRVNADAVEEVSPLPEQEPDQAATAPAA